MSIHVAPSTEDINNTLVTHIYASSAGVKLLSASGFGKHTRHVRNLSFQASVPVKVSFTLSPTKEAINEDPDAQASVLWDLVNIPANVITMCNKTCTAMKIEFTVPGELHIGVE